MFALFFDWALTFNGRDYTLDTHWFAAGYQQQNQRSSCQASTSPTPPSNHPKQVGGREWAPNGSIRLYFNNLPELFDSDFTYYGIGNPALAKPTARLSATASQEVPSRTWAR